MDNCHWFSVHETAKFENQWELNVEVSTLLWRGLFAFIYWWGYLAVPVGGVNFLTDSLRLFYGDTHRTSNSSRPKNSRAQCNVVQPPTMLQPPKLLQDFQYANSARGHTLFSSKGSGCRLHFDAQTVDWGVNCCQKCQLNSYKTANHL